MKKVLAIALLFALSQCTVEEPEPVIETTYFRIDTVNEDGSVEHSRIIAVP